MNVTKMIPAANLLHRCTLLGVGGVVEEVDRDVRVGDFHACPDAGLDHPRLLVIDGDEDRGAAGGCSLLPRHYGVFRVGVERPQEVIGITHELYHAECGDDDQEKREHPCKEAPFSPGEYEVKIAEEDEDEQRHERGGKERYTCCRLHGGPPLSGYRSV